MALPRGGGTLARGGASLPRGGGSLPRGQGALPRGTSPLTGARVGGLGSIGLVEGLTPAETRALEAELARRGTLGSAPGGGLVGNFARDFANIVTGLPATAIFGSRLVGAAAVAPLAGLGAAGVPGLGWAQGYTRGTASQAAAMARAVAADYAYRYGPLAHANLLDAVIGRGSSRHNLALFGSRVAEHPLLFGLDVAAGYGAIGKGLTLGAKGLGYGPRGARALSVQAGGGNRLERLLSYLGDTSQTGVRRARADVKIFPPLSADLPTISIEPLIQSRRAGSLNPITNRVQTAIDRFFDNRRSIEGVRTRLPQTMGGFDLPGTPTARYNAAYRRLGQDVRLESTDAARRDFTNLSRTYEHLVRKIGPIATRVKGRQGWEDALYLHTTGLLDWKTLGYGSPAQALEGVTRFFESGVAEAKAGGKGRLPQPVAESEKALESLHRLRDHPELLDPENLPPLLGQLVGEAKTVIQRGQELQSAGESAAATGGRTTLLNRQIIDASNARKARAAHGGATYEERLFRPNLPVDVGGGEIATFNQLLERQRALAAEARRIRKPAPRAAALKAAQDAEQAVKDSIRAHLAGNRARSRQLIEEARAKLDELQSSSAAGLGGARLGAQDIAVVERGVAGPGEMLSRADALDARAAALEARYGPILESLSRTGADRMRGSGNEFLSKDQVVELVLEDLRKRGGDVGDARTLLSSHDVYPLRREAVTPAKPVRWKPGSHPRGVSEAARGLIAEYDRLSGIRQRLHQRGKLGKGGEIEGYSRASIETATEAAANAVTRQLAEEAGARSAARGADLPGRVSALRARAESSRTQEATLAKLADELATVHGQDIGALMRLRDEAAIAVQNAAVGGEKAVAAAKRWAGVTEDAFRTAVAERVALAPEGSALRAALERGVADPGNPLALPAGELPIRNPADIIRAVEDVRGLREQAGQIREAVRAQPAGSLEREAVGTEIAAQLDRLYTELAGELGGDRTSTFSARRRRAQNQAAAERKAGGARPVVPTAQRQAGRRQYARTFENAVGPREAAIEQLADGRMASYEAVQRLLPEGLAREHRRQIGEVYEALGAARASFGGTPRELELVRAELKRNAAKLKRARQASTGGWTTPRPVEALHGNIPHTGQMIEAASVVDRLADELRSVGDRIEQLAADNAPETADETRALIRREHALSRRLDAAEVAYRELETHEAIRLFGEFKDGTGVYWHDRPRKGQGFKPKKDDRGGTPRPQNRIGADFLKRSKGHLFRAFNVSTARRDPLYMLQRGIRAFHSADGMLNLMGRASAKYAADFYQEGRLVGRAGEPVRGHGAELLLAANPNLYRAVHLPTLRGVLERFRNETPDGVFPEGTVLEQVFWDAERAKEIPSLVRSGEWKADDVMLIPRAAVDEYVDAAHGIFRGYDNALGVWKSGVLVFTPRWYVYNLVGNLTQYGIMSGGDIRSLLHAGLGRWVAPTKAMRARYADIARQWADATPEDVAAVAQASELGVAEGVAKLGRLANRLFAFNAHLESFIRRAAYINSAKRQLRYAGERRVARAGRFEHMIDALDEAPLALKEEALREALFFLGDYRRFNKFERSFVRRVVPFYSWIRVISRLTLGLPFKSPLRAEAISLMTQAVQAEWDPLERWLEEGRPLFARGGVDIPAGVPLVGGLTIRTNSLNPFATLNEYVPSTLMGFQRGGVSGALGGLVRAVAPSTAPGLAAIAEAATPGYNLFGNREVIAPPGYHGIVSAFGGPMLQPGVSGYEQTSGPEVPFIENVLQSVLPYYGSAARQLAAGSNKLYDTATLPAIVAARLGFRGEIPGILDSRKGQVFRPKTDSQLSDPVYPLGAISSLVGFPVSRHDLLAEIQKRLKDAQRNVDSVKQTQKRIEKLLQVAP